MAAIGSFMWHDLMTTDVEKSLTFFCGLFGWRVAQQELPNNGGNYIACVDPQSNLAVFGCVQIVPTETSRTHWISYLSASDPSATADSGASSGGHVHLTAEQSGGNMTVLTDPGGAVFAALRDAGDLGDADPRGSAFGFYELLTDDVQGAFGFYSDLFGWRADDPVDLGDGVMGVPLVNGAAPFAVARTRLQGSTQPPRWQPYVSVRDVDAATARAKELGGFVYDDPRDGPFGRSAMLIGPAGASFGVWRAPA